MAKTFTFTKSEVAKFKAKEAKQTPAQRRASNKAYVESNNRANDVGKKGKA